MLLLLNLIGTGGTLMVSFMISKLMILKKKKKFGGTKSINVVNSLNYYQHNLDSLHLFFCRAAGGGGGGALLTYKTLTFFSNFIVLDN